MIRVTCPQCRSTLNAKEKLAGETKKCPRCGTPITIPDPQELALEDAAPSDTPLKGKIQSKSQPATLLALETPGRLDPNNRYLICDRSRIIAQWQSTGQGWMLRTTHGSISAKRNRELLPKAGNFELIELQLAATDEGCRLRGIICYQLAPHWALTCLDQGDDPIMEKIIGPGKLSKEQKNAVRQSIRDQFMRETWTDAQEVLEYLGNTDYHSAGPI